MKKQRKTVIKQGILSKDISGIINGLVICKNGVIYMRNEKKRKKT